MRHGTARMMQWLLFRCCELGVFLCLFPFAESVAQIPFPHQQWYVEKSWTIPMQGNEIDVDSAGNVYVYQYEDPFGIRIYDKDGNPQNPGQNPRIVPSLENTPRFALTLDDRIIFAGRRPGTIDGMLELCDPALPDACAASSTLVSAISRQFIDLTIADDGIIYAISATGGESFSLSGTTLTSLGSFAPFNPDFVPGTVQAPNAISLLGGDIVVKSFGTFSFFDASGNFLYRFPDTNTGNRVEMTAGFGELYQLTEFFQSPALTPYPAFARAYDRNGSVTGFLSSHPNLPFGIIRPDFIADLVFSGPDVLYLTGAVTAANPNLYFIRKLRRAYRTYDPSRSGVPVPELLTASSRPGESIFDIEYIVHDADSATVTTAMLALEGGQIDLGAVRRIISVTGPVGPTTLTGVQHSVAWDAGIDLAGQGDFIQAQIQIMAQDNRIGLIPLHFISIPSAGPPGCADLTINVSPISSSEMLDAWFWLIGSADTAISFDSGQVTGVGAPFDGLLLAQGTTTFPDGRAFLFDRMQVREASQSEVDCVKEATTPGIVNQFTPANRFGNHPAWVNELGFDTGDSSPGFWVVPLP